jgi:CheY-like chemotaxis protein
MLMLEGYTVLEACDGPQALHAARHHGPAIVLLDHRMPRMLGSEVVAELMRDGFDGALVLMSATRELHQAAESSGVRHVLAKPFDATTLLEVLEDALRVARGTVARE